MEIFWDGAVVIAAQLYEYTKTIEVRILNLRKCMLCCVEFYVT